MRCLPLWSVPLADHACHPRRWCAEPALASLQSSLLFKLRIYLLVYLSWRGEDQQHLALAQGAPELPREEQQQLQLAMALGDAPAGGAPPTGGEGVAAVHVVRAPPHERGGEGEVLGFSNVDYATLGNSIPEPVHQWCASLPARSSRLVIGWRLLLGCWCLGCWCPICLAADPCCLAAAVNCPVMQVAHTHAHNARDGVVRC